MSARNVLAFPLLLFITPSCTHTHRKSTAHLGIYTLMFQNVKKILPVFLKKYLLIHTLKTLSCSRICVSLFKQKMFNPHAEYIYLTHLCLTHSPNQLSPVLTHKLCDEITISKKSVVGVSNKIISLIKV